MTYVTLTYGIGHSFSSLMLQFHNYSDHFEHYVTADYLKHVPFIAIELGNNLMTK